MITTSMQISKHFHSTEFKCQHCGNIKIDENLIVKLKHIFDKLKATKCIISSGYRCPTYDKQIGGFVGKHAEGLASDCVFYDKNGDMIPSKIVCCVAYDLGELNGIAKINDYYVHLDNRQNGYYHGDETISTHNVWTSPYDYFNVTKQDVAKYTGEETNQKVNVFAQGFTREDGWLPQVKDNNDYVGYKNHPLRYLAIGVDKGSIKYKVTTITGKILPWVTGYNIKDLNNGCAGNGEPIATVEVYYYTPNNIRPYKRSRYKVNDYDWQYDLEKGNKQDGYAGVKGVTATKFRIEIV